MINLNYALNKFHLYRENYPKTPRVQLKSDHMLRVMNNSINIATQLGLSQEQIDLAGFIGLLHDIGRFEQVKQYNTFVDKDSVNHAMYSSHQLFNNDLIRYFISDSSYDDIVRKAIENHNRFEIEDGLSEDELLQAKIIRDADKIDIYPQVLSSDASLVFDGPLPTDRDMVNPLVLQSFKSYQCVKTADMDTKIDDYVRKCALIFGFYFPEISLKTIYDSDYISQLKQHFLSTFDVSSEVVSQMSEVESIANQYLYKKTNGIR